MTVWAASFESLARANGYITYCEYSTKGDKRFQPQYDTSAIILQIQKLKYY